MNNTKEHLKYELTWGSVEGAAIFCHTFTNAPTEYELVDQFNDIVAVFPSFPAAFTYYKQEFLIKL